MHNPKKLLHRKDLVSNKRRIVASKSPDAWKYILCFLMPRGVRCKFADTIAFNSLCENMGGWRACERVDTSNCFEFSKQSSHWSELMWIKISSALHVIGCFVSLYPAGSVLKCCHNFFKVRLPERLQAVLDLLESSPFSLTLQASSLAND